MQCFSRLASFGGFFVASFGVFFFASPSLRQRRMHLQAVLVLFGVALAFGLLLGLAAVAVHIIRDAVDLHVACRALQCVL